MKKSTISALVLVTLYLSGAIICDFALAAKYRTTDLENPLKNFSQVAIKPFAVLDLSGGNGYAVEIRKGKDFKIMIMNSRKSFLKMTESGDSLKIRFAVANQTYQAPQSCVVGLIITVPTCSVLNLSGTNNIINDFQSDSLKIFQDGKTFTRMRGSHFAALDIHARQESNIDLEEGNTTTKLNLSLQNKSSLTINGISFDEFNPVVKDSARLIFFGRSLKELKGNY